MRRYSLFALLVLLGGCTASQTRDSATYDAISQELAKAGQERPKAAQPEAVSSALLPPLKVELPRAGDKPLESKFDLVVNNAPAAQVFMGIVSGTRYSMLVHPSVTGNISVNLKDVTVMEALDAVRQLYGYEYAVDGTRIFIQPLTLQTRVFQVNYLTGKRTGQSEVRINAATGITGGTQAATTATATTTTGGTGAGVTAIQSSNILTTSTADFWTELKQSLEAIVGTQGGRSVVVSPQTGVIVVRAMPEELRNVASYLKASQIAVERQVILEAKILEVELKDGYEQGINWAAFRTGGNSRISAGQITPGTILRPDGSLSTGGTLQTNPTTGAITNLNPSLDSIPGVDLLAATAVGGGLFGLAFQTSSFAALLSFLETQGTVHVLSSPRLATLNNQKAVLKVGQDELFVTNVSTTTTTGTATTTTPTVTLQSFFSGVALDVTPQIDENGNIILHVHPSVSSVEQIDREIKLGGTIGQFTVPVPRSIIQETDTIIRAQDGQIVAIGGLMSQKQTDTRSQVPGIGNVPGIGTLFGQQRRSLAKRELVILLKSTIVQGDENWARSITESRERLRDLDPRRMEAPGSAQPAAPQR